MLRLPTREKLNTWAAIAIIVVGSWAVNFTIGFRAINYVCQTQPRTPTCNTVTAITLAWLVIQHYLAIIFAGFIIGKVTGTRILR